MSNKFSVILSIEIQASITSLVVPGISLTIAFSDFVKAFRSVDLPEFGAPKIKTFIPLLIGIKRSELISIFSKALINFLVVLMALATVMALFCGLYDEALFVIIFYSIGEMCQQYAVNYSRKSIASLVNIRQVHKKYDLVKLVDSP